MSGRKPKKKASSSGNSQFQKGKAALQGTDVDALFYRATATEDRGERLAIFNRILELSPNHFDALMKIAELTPNVAAALPYARRAFALIESVAGDIQQFSGRMSETDLTMRYVISRSLLAFALMKTGAWEEGAEHAFGLIALRTGEEFGVHAMFLTEALLQRKWDAAEAILPKFADPNSDCKAYVRAMLEFLRHGASALAMDHLTTAIAHNPHVIPMLLRKDAPPRPEGLLSSFSPGSKSEAQFFARASEPAWRSIPGSFNWLRTSAAKLLPKDQLSEHDSGEDLGPIASKEELQSLRLETKRLPLHQDKNWVVDVSELSDGTWILMVLDSYELKPLLTEDFETQPIPDDVMWNLYLCMVEPEDGSEPHRPAHVEFIRSAVLAEFGPQLQRIGVDASLREDADELIQHFARMDRTQPLPDEPVKSLPQVERERWELDWRQLDTWMTDDSGESIQPWLIMVVEPKSEMVLNVEPLTDEPTREQIINAIQVAAFRPAVGEPHRPSSIRVASGDQQVMIADWLRAEGIACDVGRFKLLDDLVEDLAESVFGEQREGLTESEDIPLKLIGELYEHSAAYFRVAPWEWMAPDDLTELRCPALSSKTWIAAGMGQMSEGIGIMLFDNAQNLSNIFAMGMEADDDSGANFMQGLSISMEAKESASPADVAAAEQFGWPVGAQDAWPIATRIKGRDGFEPVNQADLQVIIAALQVVPKFWKEAVRGHVKPADFNLSIGGKSVVVKARQFRV